MTMQQDNADERQVRVARMIVEFREAQGRRQIRTEPRPEHPADEQRQDELAPQMPRDQRL